MFGGSLSLESASVRSTTIAARKACFATLPYWNIKFQRRPRAFKRERILKPWTSPMIALQLAAIEIQRTARGFIVRDALSSARWQRGRHAGRDKRPSARPGGADQRSTAAPRYKSPEWSLFACARFTLYHVAALQIQSCFRRFFDKKMIGQAVNAQPVREREAARTIQCLWRSRSDKRQFSERVQLLRFRNRGDPSVLLRSINPVEAALFDKAAKIKVRFRFGGSRFPPEIYYKVFTEAPLCDVGAFAPRDYACVEPRPVQSVLGGSRASLVSSFSLASTALRSGELARSGADPRGSAPSSDSKSIRVGSSTFSTRLAAGANSATGWYRRWENNGWRRVAAKTLAEADEDPVTRRTRDLSVRFHFSKVARRQEVVAQRKQRKREWMRKLYSQRSEGDDWPRNQSPPGAATAPLLSAYRFGSEIEAKSDDARRQGLASRSSIAARGSTDKWAAAAGDDEAKSRDVVDYDDEEDALVDWSTHLDFDRYVEGWGDLATTCDHAGISQTAAGADARHK